MTLYALIDENNSVVKYPYDLNELRKTLSFRSKPGKEFLARNGVVIVNQTKKPIIAYTENLVELDPELIGNEWGQVWEVRPASDEEIQERTSDKEVSVKRKRNRLLQDSDWTQLPDVPADREEWAKYRKELRELDSQPGYPWDITWPKEPEC